MSSWQIALVGFAAFCAGAMNAVAGGGTFFSFPALLAVGIPPVAANASNSVALWPASLSGAWAYRKELACFKRYLIPMGAVSLIGGIGGGLLLLATQDATLSRLIPWLLLFATLLFAFSGKISAWLRDPAAGKPENSATVQAGQAVAAVYGGFFGAGMGIMMPASLAMAGHDDVHGINAIKNLLSAIIYSVTVLTFIVAGAVSWPYTIIMLATAGLVACNAGIACTWRPLAAADGVVTGPPRPPRRSPATTRRRALSVTTNRIAMHTPFPHCMPLAAIGERPSRARFPRYGYAGSSSQSVSC